MQSFSLPLRTNGFQILKEGEGVSEALGAHSLNAHRAESWDFSGKQDFQNDYKLKWSKEMRF